MSDDHKTRYVQADPEAWAARRRRRRRKARRRTERWSRRRWGAAYVAGGATALLGLVGLTARWSPAEWWAQVVAGALPYLGPAAFVAAVALAVAAARTNRTGGWVLAALLAAVSLGWAFRSDSPPGARAGDFRVMTLNAGASLERGGDLDYVLAVRPHVIVLQEAAASYAPYVPLVGRLVAEGGYEVLTDTTASSHGPGRQVVLTRVPALGYEAGSLGSTVVRSGVYGRAVLSWRGEEVVVYNVHLRPFNPDVAWSWDRLLSPTVWGETPGALRTFFAEQAAEAGALTQLVRAEERPTVVAGDFNATPDQWPRALLTRLGDGRALTETTGRWAPGATRPSGVPLANIDGVLVGPEWSLARSEVGPPGLSDHRPVTAWLSLPAP